MCEETGRERTEEVRSSILIEAPNLTSSLGLKAQHVAGIRCLSDITGADVEGCQVGCKTLQFQAHLKPTDLLNRNILIKSDTAGSILMVLQTLLPFLVFAGDQNRSPLTLTIRKSSYHIKQEFR
jgi:RNA 3'-terminal phosphate cyclase